jgi:ligand-binding sensor domain-containing protein
LTLALVAGPAAPAPAVVLDNVLTGYAVSSWSYAEGLRLGSVYALAQDLDGYLWIGTDAGLIRFDGVRFVPWDRLSDTPLPSPQVSALYAARDGSLWVGCGDGGGIHRIREGRMQPGGERDANLVSVTAIIEDRHGALWAVIDRALHRLNSGRWEKVPVRFDSAERAVNSLHVDRSGKLLVGTVVGLFEYIDSSGRFQRMSNRWVWEVTEDSAGALWLTDIVTGFQKRGEAFPQRAARANGYRLLRDRFGDLWVGTLGEGLWRVQVDGTANDPTIEKITLHSGLSSDSVESLVEDREGNIWVGTTAGLHRLTRRKLNPIVNIGPAVAVEATGRVDVWVGTSNGLVRFPVGAHESQGQRTGPADVYIRALQRDNRDVLWAGALDGGLYSLTQGRLTRVPLPPEHSLTTISTMAPDPGGGFWLCDGTRAVLWDRGHLTPFQVAPTAQVEKIRFIRGGKNGRLWLAYEGGQVGVRDADGEIRTLGPEEGYRSDLNGTIFDIFEDNNGVAWIAGSGGLSRFSGGKFVTVTHESGLPRNRIAALVDDDDGQLWLNVDLGLVRLNRDEFAKAAGNPAHRLQYELYDTADGLAGVPILNVRAARDRDGRLWFVRGGGLTVVDPRNLATGHPQPAWSVRIESAVADARRLNPAPRASLPAGTKSLQVSYTAMTLTAPDKILFRYRLDGFDTEWIDAGTRRQAYYTNLPPRNYRFRVETNDGESTVTKSSATWDFSIAPMFHETSWFYAVCIVAAGLAIGGVWRVRLHLVRNQFSAVLEERARLSREIHDTLLQSLVGVALQFDAMSSSLGPLPGEVKTLFVRTRREVEAYIREARQSISDLRSPVLETQDLEAALREFGRRATAEKQARFVSTVVGRRRRYSPKVENELLRIGREAISNASRHAKAGRIGLELRFDDRWVTLRVWDDGCGFDSGCSTREVYGHYGLTSMRERTERLGGRFSITSSPGAGTTIETVIPISPAT